MMTEFKNIRIVEDGSVGEIKTLSEFSVFDCYAKKWSEKPPVIFRNIMLCGLYPNKDFCMGEIRDTEKDYRRLNPFKAENDDKPWFLDLASGARTDGRFTFARDTTIGKLYYGEPDKDQWKRIIYGSIMHTGCKKLIYKQMKYIVVDDEAKNQNGNPQDDPTNQFHWRTGDSHAKASGALMTLLEITKDENGEPIDGEIPIQFRATLPSRNGQPGWVGKGTVSWNPHCDEKGIDLVIPLSSLKGNKPELGNYEGKLLIGTVFEAEERRTKLGWMIWQWFAFKTLEDDRIISKLHERCQKLSAAFNSIQNLAEILQVDQKESDKLLQETSEPVETDDYKSPVLRIIKAENNEAGLDAVKKFLDGIKAEAPWLKDFKDESCYRNRPCAVDPDAEDTVSRIVKIVNSYYREPSFGAPISPRDFLSVLFGDVPHTPEQYQHALSERARYRKEMAAASNLAAKQAGGDALLASQLRSQYMKQISANFRTAKESIFEILDSKGEKYDRWSWVSAYWKVAHEAASGTAGLVFSVFRDEIIEALEGNTNKPVEVIEVYNVHKWATLPLWKTKRWTGQFVQYKAVVEELIGAPKLVNLTIHIRSTKVEMDFFRLGIVGDKYVGLVPPGSTGVMRICTHRTIDGINKSVKLFGVNTTPQEAQEQLATNFWKEEWPDS